MLLATSVGVLAAAFAWLKGISQARAVALSLGFPCSLWLLGSASFPAWVWLLPLALIVWIYPMHAWRDAPVFPTPLHALRDVPRFAILPAQAKILDAGCGAGDGLKALRLAYVNAQWTGIEFSRPLCWVAKFRCPWAEVRCGDIWEDHWGAYDMVYLFQRPETMPRAVEKAKAEMKPGAWLVSLEFEAAELQANATTEASPGRPVWLYQAPFNKTPDKVFSKLALTASTQKR
jgi:SAM-dependent methyltransferase